MKLRVSYLVALVLGTATAPLTSCGEDIVRPSATTGSLKVSVTTTGRSPYPAGYSFIVDSREPVAAESGATWFTNISVGAHHIALTGMTSNCAVQGDNPRRVEVTEGESAAVEFAVVCSAPTGRIDVTVTTTGTNLDPDGYLVLLDGGGATQPVGINGTVSFSAVPDGSHQVSVTGTIPFCVAGNGQTVTLRGQTASVAVDVSCTAPLPGRLLAWGSIAEALHVTSINLDGSQSVDLTSGGTGQGARWSPDGRRIVFAGTFQGAAGIYVMDADGSNRRQLTTDGGESPAWSPDGRRIVYSQSGLVVMNADGSGRANITSAMDANPAWSPDGTQIAFSRTDPARCRSFGVSPRFCTADLYVVHPDGSALAAITTNDIGVAAVTPAWSHDGRIAYARSTVSQVFIGLIATWRLYVRNGVGGPPSRVTQVENGNERSPVWSPDGETLAYSGGIGATLGYFGSIGGRTGVIIVSSNNGERLAAFTAVGLEYPSDWR
jgi:Tol biopolymer transport system component